MLAKSDKGRLHGSLYFETSEKIAPGDVWDRFFGFICMDGKDLEAS